ncbi:malonyl-CoA-acyl carrier protein transacylase, mitochondrial-like [Amphiura filiformis]|uniref:malonyl-CoA-acyl carrier protein transacylase, mitochondrial-like n=1 Tax=Amphiura filiformis TaxID=82378 RepID=UPI003B2160F7
MGKAVGTLLMFPGQGAEKRGMCMSMKGSAEAKAIFKRAKEVLGYDLLDILLSNNDTLAQKLKSTEFVQVSLLVSCIAKIEQLRKDRTGLIAKVTHVAGLSVGEFAALVFAGVIKFEDALHLVQERGKAMEFEVQRSPTGIVSVFGIGCEVLQNYLESNFPNMQISTYLADNQHTIAGKEHECEALTESLQKEFSEEIIDVRQLRVAGAFHSKYMSNASQGIDPIINGIEFKRPTLPVIMNASGTIVQDPQQIKTLLREQLVKPVQWKRSILAAYKNGVQSFVEVAPARILSSIVKNRIAQCQDCDAELVIV